MSEIEIKPIKTSKTTIKQSKYDVASRLPTRGILCGPSGAGKGTLLSSMILDIYRDCFDRILIFSPSIHLDDNWLPTKEYIINKYGPETEDNVYFHEEFDAELLEKEIKAQKHIVQYYKDKKKKRSPSLLIIIDDFLDNEKVSRHSPLIHQLFIRGRHSCISTLISTQKWRGLSPLIRINCESIYVFRLRNNLDLDGIIEETSALVDKKILLNISRKCTEEPY